MFNDPLALTLACLAGTFGGGLLGLWLRARVLRHHVDSNVKESVKLGVGMVATMTALLLGLIMASAKSNFDSVDLAVREAATRIITVDRALADLGEAALPARQAWHEAVNRLVDGVLDPQSATPDSPLVRPESLRLMDRAADLAGSLTTQTARQRQLQSKALDQIQSLIESRWLTTYLSESAIPPYFMAAVLVWLAITFFCYGLVSPLRRVVVLVFFICSLSAASAILLTLELEMPFDHWVTVSWQPLIDARQLILR